MMQALINTTSSLPGSPEVGGGASGRARGLADVKGGRTWILCGSKGMRISGLRG